MEPTIHPGARLRCSGCGTEGIVVRAPTFTAVVECCGQPMSAASSTRVAARSETPGTHAAADGAADGLQVGKRYIDTGGDLELLCVRAGRGPLSLLGRPLTVAVPKLLPSSD